MKIDRFLCSAIAFAAVLGACGEDGQTPRNGTDDPKPNEPTLRLAQGEVWVRRGETASVPFAIEPAGALETIAIVRARDLPEGVTAGDVVLEPGGEGKGELLIAARLDARTGGPLPIQVEAVIGEVTRTASFDLTVAGLPGELDESFGDGGIVHYDDERLLAGNFENFIVTDSGMYVLINTLAHGQLFRMQQDGSIDRSFGTEGVLTFEFGDGLTSKCSLAAFDSLRVVVACKKRSESQDQTLAIVVQRLLDDGRPDSTFGRDGALEIPNDPNLGYEYRPLVGVDSENRILVATSAFDWATSERSLLAWRIGRAGELDPEWGEGSVVEIKHSGFLPFEVNSVLALADGNGYVVAGAQEDDSGGFSGFTIALDNRGRIVESFGASGFVDREKVVENAALSGDGAIYLNEVGRIVRLTPSGQLDPGFGVDGVLEPADYGLHAVISDPDGSILGAGYWLEPDRAGPMLFRLSEGLDSDFSARSRIDNLPNEVTAQAVTTSSSGRILAALRHYPLSENKYFAIARFWP